MGGVGAIGVMARCVQSRRQQEPVAALHTQNQIGSTAKIRRVQESIKSKSGAQGVPGGVPVDHWISKMLIQDPKGGASRSLKSYSEY